MMVDRQDDPNQYRAADLAFHRGILAATHNQFMVGLIPIVEAMLRVSFQFSLQAPAAFKLSLPAHQKVLDTILRRDHDGASDAMLALIERATRDIARHKASASSGEALLVGDAA